MSNEKDNFGKQEQDTNRQERGSVVVERPEANAHEQEHDTGEQQQERLNDARKETREALEHTAQAEKESRRIERAAERSPAERRGPASAREREKAFDTTMLEVRSQMSGPSRAFSSFIHSPIIDKASDFIGGTIARPNAIASGSLFAFLFTLVIYLVARFYGYPLSGTETIASFAVGWVIGILYDYLRLLVTGKK